jgi:hypothetical protein
LCEALVLASVFIDQTLFVYLDPFGPEDYDFHTIGRSLNAPRSGIERKLDRIIGQVQARIR